MRRLITICVAVLLFGMSYTKAGLINFDDMIAPPAAYKTVALTEYYAPLGVHFQTPGSINGGIIVNWISGFGIMPHSGDNFLAFNREAMTANGGIPTDLETITFDNLMKSVSIYCNGSRYDAQFKISAYDINMNLIDSRILDSPSYNWTQLSINSEYGIKRVVLEETGYPYFVYDDLSFQPIPEPTTVLLLGLSMLALRRKY